jgi:hypothetical protein
LPTLPPKVILVSRERTPPWCRASKGIFAAFDEQS